VSAPLKTRQQSIDALRGVGLLLMLVDHCFDWWLSGEYRGTFADTFTEFLGTLAAPIFLILAGLGVAFAAASRRKRGLSRHDILLHFLRRGLWLIAAGYLLNLAVFFVGDNAADIFAVDILHLIGFGIILIALIEPLPAPVIALLSAAWAVLGALGGGAFALPEPFGAWVNGSSGIGYFPLLPWLAYMGMGAAVGKWLRSQFRDESARVAPGLGLMSAAGFGLMIILPNAGYRHPRLGFIGFSLGVTFALWLILYMLERRTLGFTQKIIIAPLALLGRQAFFLYAFHHLIGYRLFYALGWVTGRAWHGQYGTFNPHAALIGFLTMIVLCYAAARIWPPIRGRLLALKRPSSRTPPPKP
jgi:uncharacterized membrane protein